MKYVGFIPDESGVYGKPCDSPGRAAEEAVREWGMCGSGLSGCRLVPNDAMPVRVFEVDPEIGSDPDLDVVRATARRDGLVIVTLVDNDAIRYLRASPIEWRDRPRWRLCRPGRGVVGVSDG